jgi:pilus assembly protein Flp/PilA
MTKFMKSLLKDESGATAIEYGLLAALIAVVIIGVVTQLGGELNETFAAVESQLDSGNSNPPPDAD